MNRYFIGTKLTADICNVIVGSFESQRQSKDGTYLVKLPIGDKEKHECLKDWQEVDLQTELKNDRWL